MSIRLKQILGVTALVGAVVVALSVAHLARIARLSLEESRARGELLTNAVFHRAYEVVTSREAAYAELAADAGIRSILQAAIYSDDVTYGGDRRRLGRGGGAQRSVAGRAAAAGGRQPAGPAGAQRAVAALADLVVARPHAGMERAAAARRRGARRDPHRHLDAAGAPLARGHGDAGAGRRHRPAAGGGAGVALPGPGGAAPDPRHPEQPHPAGPRRTGRDAGPRGSRDAGPPRRVRRRQRAAAGAAGRRRGAPARSRRCPSASPRWAG